MILALDPAGMTGYCDKDKSGVFDCRPKGKEDSADRIIKFRTWLREYLQGSDTEMIVYEKPGGRNYSALRSHSHLECVIMAECADRGLGYLGFSAPEIKKYATGNGNANKAAMMAAASAKWPEIEIIDDNHADALWIYDYALTKLIIQ